MPRVRRIDNATLPELQAFKKRHEKFVPPSYIYDVVRFSNKVFAVYDALYDHKGIGVWIDADMVPYRDIPKGYIESLLKPGDYVAMFRRNFHSECGLWVVDCSHPEHQSFMEMFRALYTEDKFKALREWHDSYLMDKVVEHFEREAMIRVTNLSDSDGAAHPMATHEIAKYLDHLKGPSRKNLGFSPENQYRNAA